MSLSLRVPKAQAATYVVDNAADTNLGACTALANDCTLRGAINRANNNRGGDVINFDLPSSRGVTPDIQITSDLPSLTMNGAGTIIDGYSQPGAQANTIGPDTNDSTNDFPFPTYTNTVLKVRIRGNTRCSGLIIRVSGCVVRGLSITDTINALTIIGPSATRNIVIGNYIGTGNARGVLISGAPGNTIGGVQKSDCNLISGNFGSGVTISGDGASGNRVVGNIVRDNFGRGDAASAGILIAGAPGNSIGGTSPSAGNFICNNSIGVYISGIGTASAKNTIRKNSITDNKGLGVDLSSNESRQSFPVLTSAKPSGGRTFVSGTLNSTANTNFILDFYSNNVADPSGYGEGERYFGSTTIITNASGNASFNATLAGASVSAGAFVSATATDPSGNTSDFCKDIVVTDTALVVTTPQDSLLSDGFISLREAVNYANSHAGADTITFAIAGTAVQTIHLNSPLALSDNGTTIDGYSQPGASTNTLATGSSATLLIQIQGRGTSSNNFNGFVITGANCTVRGLAITNCFIGLYISGKRATGNKVTGNFIGTDSIGVVPIANNMGICIDSAPGNTIGGPRVDEGNTISGNSGPGVTIRGNGASGNTVSGNLIGIDPSGTTVVANNMGICIDSAPGNTIGGNSGIGDTSVGQGNIISGNSGIGITITGINARVNTVSGNVIGTDISGTVALPNYTGVFVTGASGNIIGGTSAGEGNIISGNFGNGLYISGSNGNTVLGNSIGTDASGTTSTANNTGVLIVNSSGNTIGGVASDERNLIYGNSNGGIVIIGINPTSSTGNRMRGNSITSNGGLGIDLDVNGVSANDTGDGDTGANTLQNFPVLTSAASNGSNTTIIGTLASTASSPFILDFYANPNADPSGYGQGQIYLGSTTVTTNANGNAAFSFSPPSSDVSDGMTVSATATDRDGNTSEFSQSVKATTSGPDTGGPTAGPYDDFVGGRQNVTQKILASTLLTNDYRALGRKNDGSLQLVSFKTPRNFEGTLKFAVIRAYPTFLTYTDKSTLIYTPRATWSGETQFEYTVLDKTTGKTYSAQVFLTIGHPPSSQSSIKSSLSPSGGAS